MLLRESYRDVGKVKKLTLANLTKCPPPSCRGCEPCSKAASPSRASPRPSTSCAGGIGCGSTVIVRPGRDPHSLEYPGERLMVCRSPLLAEACKREALLRSTEALLDPIVAATRRDQRRLQGQEKIALRVGKVIGKYKMAKHFDLEITEGRSVTAASSKPSPARPPWTVCTSCAPACPRASSMPPGTVSAYKRLSQVERTFRSFKTVDLKVRPIFHYTPDRVRAHVLLCMLAYYVEWPMRQALAPLLFDDDDRAGAEAARTSVVAPAQVSPRAQDKARRKRTATSWPVHSFRTLLDDLATLARNRIAPRLPRAEPLNVLTRPTAL